MADTGPWYRHAFRADYLDRYAHRNEAEARGFVRTFVEPLLAGGGVVLDLCAGACRHSIVMAEAGARVVAYDLSAELLGIGRDRLELRGLRVQLVRGDMRSLPFADGSFRVVVNAFTAFGYFQADEEDMMVLREVARSLSPGGRFILDFANRAPLVRRLGTTGRSGEVRTGDGRLALEVRRMSPDLRRVERVREAPPGSGAADAVLESVRLYSPAELEGMLGGAGLSIARTAGDYEGAPFDQEASDRLVLVAVR